LHAARTIADAEGTPKSPHRHQLQPHRSNHVGSV